MRIEPVYLRWENTTTPHRKFYEIEVELSLFYPKILVRRWGRIGARRPRSIRMLAANPDELERWVDVISKRRERHGYKMSREIRVPAIGTFAA